MLDIINEIVIYAAQVQWVDLLDIALVTLTIYGLLRLVRGTQAETLLRGIILLVVSITLLTQFLPLKGFSWLLQTSLPAILIAIPVIFAPEIRRGLERLGRAGADLRLGMQPTDVQPIIQALVTAAQRLSERRYGALIVIERQVGLKEYQDTGTLLEARLTPELLLQIFYPNTPLHDGAAIVREDRIAAAACVLPLTASSLLTERRIGLRHRAALGITEVSDAVAIVVSEETGTISVAHNGRMIRRLDAERLTHMLDAFYQPHLRRSWRDVLTRWLASEWVAARTARRNKSSGE
ncbi:MAG: diadenylate cyclase CdaA [Anaerolineales bacterium]|nr:diadenylate cyclase CdaA [Anaerolineales bacterium]